MGQIRWESHQEETNLSAIDTCKARRFMKAPKRPEVYESSRSAQRLMKVAEVSGTKSAIGI